LTVYAGGPKIHSQADWNTELHDFSRSIYHEPPGTGKQHPPRS